MNKKQRILLVANSVPLPATDFLKYKIFGLSQIFDLHLLCWDSDENRKAFYEQYSDKLHDAKIHLFYNKWNLSTFISLLFTNLFRIIFSPFISLPLVVKLISAYGWDLKKLFIKFSLYFPIAKLKPDVIHFEYGTLARSFSDIKKFVPCKTTVSFRGYDLNYVGLDNIDYYDSVWQNFDGFHFLGNDLKKRALKRGYKTGKTEILIPPAIDTSFFSAHQTKKQNDKLIIISVGRLAWKKGYEYGLQAVAILKKKNIPFEYRIVADGDYIQPILFAIEELGLQQDVQLIGGKSPAEIKKELANADVFLHPAISEGFSNAVLEAQAMGLPVITTDADGLAENVQDGVTGFVMPVYDVSAMAEKLEWCNTNRDKLTAMGKAGIERVRNNFRIEDQMRKFEEFYKAVHES